MLTTELLQCWTEGPERMDDWNFRPLETSHTWDALWGSDWWYRWSADLALIQFFIPFSQVLTERVRKLDYLYPFFEVEVTIEYTFLTEPSGPLMSVPTLSGFPYGGMRAWQNQAGDWLGVIAQLEKVTITPFDPRSPELGDEKETVEEAVVWPGVGKTETAVVEESKPVESANARKRKRREPKPPFFVRGEDGSLIQTDKP